MNIPIGGLIEENNTLEIVVKGFEDNLERFQGRFVVSNSNQIKIVDKDNQYISFQDLKPGMYVQIRLYYDGTEYPDMYDLPMVTTIKCSETKEDLYEKM